MHAHLTGHSRCKSALAGTWQRYEQRTRDPAAQGYFLRSLLPLSSTPHRRSFQTAWQLGAAPSLQDPLSLLLLDFADPAAVYAQVLFREKERQRYQRTLTLGHCVFLSYTTAPSPFGARVVPRGPRRGDPSAA